MEPAQKSLRILAVVNLPWDPRLGAPRVWIELAEEWTRAGHTVEKFCLTDAFPRATSSAAMGAIRTLLFPFRAASLIRANAEQFDVIDAVLGSLPFSKKSLSFKGLLVARSVGLYRLYEKFEQAAATRWPKPSKDKLRGRIFYGVFNKRMRAASEASVKHCDLLNLPNADELLCLRDEMRSTKPAAVQPYGLALARRDALRSAAASAESRWQKKEVSFLGMWSARKGARDWRKIIQRVRAQLPETKFLFLGTMVENAQVLQDLDLGAPDFVKLVPRFEPDELPGLLSACTVGAFPSYVEGFGLAILEQLCAGIPTVAYDAPGARTMLKPSLPELLVPTGDVEKLADAIVRLLRLDVAEYERLVGRSREVAEQFSWSAIAEETLRIYRAALETTKHAV